jgi:hypothetical protein
MIYLSFLAARIEKVKAEIATERQRHQEAISKLETEYAELDTAERVILNLSTAASDGGSSDHNRGAASDRGSQTEDAEANEANRSADLNSPSADDRIFDWRLVKGA